MIRLLLVDDQPLALQGLASMLSLSEDMEIVGQAATGSEAIVQAERLRPDVILMDVQMPGCDGIEATRQILRMMTARHVLILTTFDDDEYVLPALQAGATGYLLKDTRSQDLIGAIRLVHTGHIQISPTVAPKVLERLQPYVPRQKNEILAFLSQREIDVLKLIGEGMANQEIAAALCLSDGTVKNYVSSILTHLGVRDRTQAALWAYKHISGHLRPTESKVAKMQHPLS